MNIFQIYKQEIKDIFIKNNIYNDKLLDKINVEFPRDLSHGDLSTNAAMILASSLKMAPRDLAEIIIKYLKDVKDVSELSIAGPGFINIKLTSNFWHNQLRHILDTGLNYGKSDIGKNIAINVEYVSANPTGPMHVGHCRGAVVGDVIANLLEFVGYKVTKEYYVNDAGGQIDILAQSVLLRYREALGEEIKEIPSGLYPGEYLMELGKKLALKYNDTLLHNPCKLDIVKNFAVEEMLILIKEDLLALNIKHDIFFSEKELHKNDGKEINDTICDLTLKGYIYKGILEAPKAHQNEEWEPREQILFKSTNVGDDQDRALIKSDGSYTYFAADVAYFRDKFKRGFKNMIYILGADHSGYAKRLQAVSQAIAGDKNYVTVLFCQLVKLLRDGEPVKMSKRSGSFITLRDVVNEVGCDPVRFMMIFRKNDAPLDFDFTKVTEQTKDNPVFYVQYAVARCYSIFKQLKEHFNINIDNMEAKCLVDNISLLQDQSEIEIIKRLAFFPQLIQSAAIHKEPHRLAYYLYELASMFHTQWSKGNENTSLRFIQKEKQQLSLSKVALIKAICNILTTGLGIIKVDAPRSMH